MSNLKIVDPHPFLKFPMDEKMLLELACNERDFLLLHGGCFRVTDSESDSAVRFAPFFLFPSLFPQRAFQEACAVQPLMNQLMLAVAHDRRFLTSCLTSTIEVDDFTASLFKIYTTVWDEGLAQAATLGLLRSDYFYDVPTDAIKQVELNTIASSFGALSSVVNQCHRSEWGVLCLQPATLGLLRSDYFTTDLTTSDLCQVEVNCIAAGWSGMSQVTTDIHRYALTELGFQDKLKQIPENRSLSGIAEGMLQAWDYYAVSQAVILFVVEDRAVNLCDQRFHEFEIYRQRPGVRVIRRSHGQLIGQASLDTQSRLIVDGYEVALVYYRTGYTPRDYPTQREWDVRLLIERSRAVKSPSIHLHLAGTKKVQQVLARAGVLERFLDDTADVERCRRVFTGLYGLDMDEDGDAAVAAALAAPERFVLKPQREGGGNNVYDSLVADTLRPIQDSPQRTAFILMDRIEPHVQPNYLLRADESTVRPQLVDTVSELGIFGYVLGEENRMLRSECCGFTLRSKPSSVLEGGIASGFGAMDSPYLV